MKIKPEVHSYKYIATRIQKVWINALLYLFYS